MPKTATPDAPPAGSFATGPAGGEKHTGDTCDHCGRGELVKTTFTLAEGQAPVLDTAGDEVKDGAHVTVCALCGAVQTSKSVNDGGRTGAKRKTAAKAKRKTAAARKSKTTASTRRKSSSSRKRSTVKRAAAKRSTTGRR